MNETIALIGAGRLASVVGPALASAGAQVVAVASRNPASAAALAARIRGARACTPQEAADAAGLVLVTTTDGAVAEVAGALRWRAGQGVVHCSGALTREALAPALAQGAQTGSWHPFQTLSDAVLAWAGGDARRVLEGVTFGIEAEAGLYACLAALAEAVGGRALAVPASARALYHAASVMSCGYLTTLLDAAATLWERAGLPREAAFAAIGPLARATLESVLTAGPEAALTGPTSRGDEGTVRLHLGDVDARAPELRALYEAVSRRSVELARRAGRAGAERDWEPVFRRGEG
jgi:predicted short-subunit dehydrogenase-like oxidoreductase (DUF2520 family)